MDNLTRIPWMLISFVLIFIYRLIEANESRKIIILDFILVYGVYFLFTIGFVFELETANFEIKIPLAWIIFLVLIIFIRKRLANFFLVLSNIWQNLTIGLLLGSCFAFISMTLSPVENGTLYSFSLILFLDIVGSSIGEEMIFRGYILGYSHITKKPFLIMNILQSVIFFLGHLQHGLQAALVSFLFAIFLGVFAWKDKSIFGPIIAHSVANTILALG